MRYNLLARTLLFLCCFWFLSLSASAQPAQVRIFSKARSIKLFESTRSDIEAIFRPLTMRDSAESGGTKTVYYDLLEANLMVYYSTGRCDERKHDGTGYNVGRSVVLGLDVLYFEPVNFSLLGLKRHTFHTRRDIDNNAFIFSNDQLGIELVGDKRRIRSFEINPTGAEEARFRCRSVKG